MRGPAARRFCAAFVCAASIVASGAASSQPQKKPPGKLDPKMAEAKRLFDEGADLYARGSYEEAIDAWEKSYEISKKPLIYESIANAYERLGQPRKARDYLGRWREAAPPDEHELLDTRLKKLDERIAHEDALEASRKAAEEAKEKRETKPASDAAVTKPDAMTPSDGGSSVRTIGFVLAGAGIGAVAVGVTLDIVAAARRPDPAKSCKPTGSRVLCSATAKDGIESSNALATIGDIIWIGGAVAAVGGAVLILTRPGGPEKAASARVAPLVTAGGGGVALDGRF